MTDFPRLLGALSDCGVEFIIVGGLAATVHGSARLTQDVDVVYGRSESNIERLVRALADLKPYLRGAPAGLPFIWDVETMKRGLNFTLSTDGGDIDLLGEISGGGSYEVLLGDTIEVELFGRACRVLDLKALIRAKRASGRPKDLDVLAELETLRDAE